MGLLEDLIGGSGKPVTPGLLDAAGYMDPAQYDRARRSSSMDGLWAGLLAGGAPSLAPRNFFSALGTGMQGREQYGEDFDQQQLRAAQAAKARGDVLVSGESIRSQRLGQQIVQDILKRRQQGGEGSGSTGGQATAPGVGDGGGGTAGAGGGGGGGGGGRGGWGPHADTAIATLKEQGFSDAAIQGIMANGLGEGGFAEPWRKAGGGENSFGHWQFHQGGELDGYLAWVKQQGGDPQDTRLQTLYAAKRAEEVHPGFKTLDDPKAATDIFATKFERYKGAAPGQRYGFLADAQGYIGRQPVEERQPIPEVGTRSLDQPAIASAGRPGFDTMFPDPGGRAASLGAPVPAAIAAGVPGAAPAPGATTPPVGPWTSGIQVGGANILPPRDQAAAPPAATGAPGLAPPAPISTTGKPGLARIPLPTGNLVPKPGDNIGGLIFKGGDPYDNKNWVPAPQDAVTPGQGASLGPPDTVVATRAPPPIPGLGGVPPVAEGAPGMQLAAMTGDGGGPNLVSGLRPRPAPAPAAMVPDATPAAAAAGPPGVMPGAFTPAMAANPNAPIPAMPAPPAPIAPPPLPPRAGGQVQIPALPAPAPGMTTGGLTAPQLRQSQDMQDLSLAFSLMKIPVPSFVEKQAELQAAGQLAAAQKAATQPFEFQMKLFEDSLQQRRDEWNKLSDQQKDQVAAANNMQRDQYKAGLDAMGDRIKQFTAAGLAGQTAQDTETGRLRAQETLLPKIEADKARQVAQAQADVAAATQPALEERREIAKGSATRFNADAVTAQSAAESLYGIDEARDLIKGGIISGKGANFLLEARKIGARLGWSNDKIANTETFISQRAQEVANAIKAFGSGTAISTSDREYTAKMVGGDIALDQQSLEKLLDIEERVKYRTIERFNKQAAAYEKDDPKLRLQVELPARRHPRMDLPTITDPAEAANTLRYPPGTRFRNEAGDELIIPPRR